MQDGDFYIGINTNSTYVYMNGVLTRTEQTATPTQPIAQENIIETMKDLHDSQTIEYYKLQMAMAKEEEPEEIEEVEFLGNIEK